MCSDKEIEANYESAIKAAKQYFESVTEKDHFENHHDSLQKYFESELKARKEPYRQAREKSA